MYPVPTSFPLRKNFVWPFAPPWLARPSPKERAIGRNIELSTPLAGPSVLGRIDYVALRAVGAGAEGYLCVTLTLLAGGKGFSFQACGQYVRLWFRRTNLGPSQRAASLTLRMNSAARPVCLSAGGDHLDTNGGTMHMLGTLKDYFAPEAVDPICQEVARFL